jgi:HPt (histidine-containing phosphotransfer) domain-containing protein
LNAGAAGEEPIHTTLATDGELAPLVEQYVARLRTLGRELRRALDAKELEGVRRVCQAVKGTAAGFGFSRIAELAREAVHCIDSSTSIADSALQIQQLESACFRAVANRKAA